MPQRRPATVCDCFDAVGSYYGTATITNTSVPLRQRQVRRPAVYVEPPLLSRLLRPGGRGGANVRISLWLWSVFEAHARSSRGVAPVFESRRGEVATRLHLIGAEDGKRKREAAARRVDNAFARLRRDGLVQRLDRRSWLVLQDDGTTSPYRTETSEELAARLARRGELLAVARYGQRSLRYDSVRRVQTRGPDSEARGVVVHDYWEQEPIAVPLWLWANGWVSGLSGAALVTLLVLLDQSRSAAEPSQVVVPRIRRSQYSLTKEVWRKGRDELVAHRIIAVGAGAAAGAVRRDRYEFFLDQLAKHHLCQAATS